MISRNVVHHRDNKTMSSSRSNSSSSSSSRPTIGIATTPTTPTTVTAAFKNNNNNDDDNDNSKYKNKNNKRYGGKYFGGRTFILFWIFVFLSFDRNIIRRGISTRFLYFNSSIPTTTMTDKSKYNPYGNMVAERMNHNMNNNNNMNNNSNNANRTIGQKIIERSYYHLSGYHDLVTEFCPPPPPSSSSASVQGVQQQPPSTIRQDFILNCLQKAKLEGNTPSTSFFKKWPWWFRTLLRDTVPRETGLGEPWHILQFTNVGIGSSSGSSSNSSTTNSDSNSNFNSYIDNDDDNNNPRLQLCVYEKGGTKNWKRLQCAHNHNYDTNQTNNIDYNQCYQKQPLYDEQLLTLKLKSNSKSKSKINIEDAAGGGGGGGRIKSDKVVFLRDPLDRFLSGFLDKCVRRHDKGVDHCEPIAIFSPSGTTTTTTTTPSTITGDDNTNTTSSINNISPIDTMLWDNQRKFQAYVDTFPLKWNMHFFPQSFYCGGLYRTIQDYDFIGTMTGNQFYDDLNRLQNKYPGLSKHGMDDIFHHLNSKSNSNSDSRKNNKNKKNENNNIGIETGAAGKVLEYYTPHTVKRVLEYYAIDYIMLNLTIPKWAEEMLQLEETEEYIL